MGQRPNDAGRKDAQIKLRKEECAKGMGQRSKYARRKDARIKFKRQECASSMGQRSNANYAAKKDAQTMVSEEDSVGATEKCPNVVRLNAQIKLSMEDCASSMGRKSPASNAAQKDAQINLN